MLLPVNICDRLTTYGAFTCPVCVNQSLHSALYRKYHAWMTYIATLRSHVIVLIAESSSKNMHIFFVVFLLFPWTQSHNQAKKKKVFTSTVLLDIIPHKGAVRAQICGDLAFVHGTNEWEINLTELMWVTKGLLYTYCIGQAPREKQKERKTCCLFRGPNTLFWGVGVDPCWLFQKTGNRTQVCF